MQGTLSELWPHQADGIDKLASVATRYRSPVLVSPTGGGKTRLMCELAVRATAKGKRVLILTNRRILFKQSLDALVNAGIYPGLMAAGYSHNHTRCVQLASVQTLTSRVIDREVWSLPPSDLVLVDEAHSNANGAAASIIQQYSSGGACVVGFTATPVNLNGLYNALVEAGTIEGLQDAGVLVKGKVFAPSEVSMKGISVNSKTNEFSEKASTKRILDYLVIGDVIKHFMEINPDFRPSVLFAPSVEASIGYAHAFGARGIAAEHIDGTTPEEERLDTFRRMESGDTILVSSCGVLREGWNFPAVSHGILCQPCNAIHNFLQIVGRIKRASQGKTEYTLQDHVGAWWRHGSADVNREWTLDSTSKQISNERKERIEKGEERMELCCPRCGRVREGGKECENCGHRHEKSGRMVISAPGKLVLQTGDPIKRKASKDPKEKAWMSMLFSCGMSNQTMAQARRRWEDQHGERLGDFKNVLPPEDKRWNSKVRDVYPWTDRRRR